MSDSLDDVIDLMNMPVITVEGVDVRADWQDNGDGTYDATGLVIFGGVLLDDALN